VVTKRAYAAREENSGVGISQRAPVARRVLRIPIPTPYQLNRAGGLGRHTLETRVETVSA
jgi:hypothetical protein